MFFNVLIVILVILSVLLGALGEVWKGPYQGNSDMVRSSAGFWFVPVAAVTALMLIIRFAA
jgi:hypothetical protein